MGKILSSSDQEEFLTQLPLSIPLQLILEYKKYTLMRKNKYIYFIALSFLFTLSACNKILDELPDSRTEIDTPEEIQEFLVSAYPNRYYMYIIIYCKLILSQLDYKLSKVFHCV